MVSLITRIQGRADGAETAAALGLSHVEKRPLIAEQFLKLAQTGSTRNSRLCLLEARLADRSGDFEKAERIYREGWGKVLASQRSRSEPAEPAAGEADGIVTESNEPGNGDRV